MNICICVYTYLYNYSLIKKSYIKYKHFESTWNTHKNKLCGKINFKRPEMIKKANKNSLSTTLIFGKLHNSGKRMKKETDYQKSSK